MSAHFYSTSVKYFYVTLPVLNLWTNLMDFFKSLIGFGLNDSLEQNRILVTPVLSDVIISAHFVSTLDLLLIFCISAHSVADRQRKSHSLAGGHASQKTLT